MSTIALLTDLGTDNWFAGELKGTILSLNPRAVIIDVTHALRRGADGVRDGAFALLASYRNFPEDTVFLVAADYGSIKTRVIAAKTASHVFIAPDNGVLSWALRREPSAEIREVSTDEFRMPTGCSTFPARDLLAPLAAALTDWLEFEQCGTLTKKYEGLEGGLAPFVVDTASTSTAVVPNTKERKGNIASTTKGTCAPPPIVSTIIYIDSYGNAVTSLSPRELAETCGGDAVCIIDADDGGVRRIPIHSDYGAVPEGSPVAYPGSASLMEIAVNGGSAAEMLGIAVGDSVTFAADS